MNILIVLIVVVGFFIDQMSKLIIENNVEYGQMISIIDDVLYITFHTNKGASFGIMQNYLPMLIVITTIASIAMIIYIIKTNELFLKITLSIILAGALGNLYDRIFKGAVIDFIDFYIFGYNFPAFNAADSFVTVGAVLLTIFMLFIDKPKTTD